MLIILSVSRDLGVSLCAARFTTGYVRLVGQEPAPSRCVLVSTSWVVRKEMRDWILSHEGDKWPHVRDHGGHLDTTFRVWSATLASMGNGGHFSAGAYFCSSA